VTRKSFGFKRENILYKNKGYLLILYKSHYVSFKLKFNPEIKVALKNFPRKKLNYYLFFVSINLLSVLPKNK
jgi:hypothetical protein